MSETVTEIDSDSAAYAALAKEYDEAPKASEPEVKEAKTEPQPEPAKEEANAEDKKSEQPKPIPYEELERRHRNLNGALAEARAQARADRERMAQFEQVLLQLKNQRQAPQDDQYEDPAVSAIRQVQTQTQELAQRQQQFEEQRRQQQEEALVNHHVSLSEQEFSKSTPDYFDAVRHLVDSRMNEMSIMYPDDDPQVLEYVISQGFAHPSQWRHAMVMREAHSIGQQALRARQNPAQIYYNLAKHRGWSGPKPAAATAPMQAQLPAPKAPPGQRVEAIKKGMEAPGSLSNGASRSESNAEGFPSMEELADMYVSDPAKAEKTFKKMAAAGLIG